MKELIEKYVGKKAYIQYGNLTIPVEVKDVKNSYGVIRCLVSPINGSGQEWKENVIVKNE